MIRKSENLALHNTKIKTYPDGHSLSVSCNYPIFREAGFEYDERTKPKVGDKPHTYNLDNVHDDSLKRARDKVYDIVYCNEWTWFLTISFDRKKVDSTNCKEVVKKLRTWLNHQTQRKGLRYLLLPEFHDDGKKIHCHALINDCDFTFDFKDIYKVPHIKKPMRKATVLKRGFNLDKCQKVYNVRDWRFGWSTAVRLYGDINVVAFYMLKYMTKDLRKIFGSYYWAGGRGLNRNPDISLTDVDYFDVDTNSVKLPNCSKEFKYYFDEVSYEKHS